MTKISVTKQGIEKAAKKYARLVVTEDAPSWHRLVECKDGSLEYRMGAGKWKEMDARKFITFMRSIVQAAVLVTAVAIFLMNILIDLAYAMLDPRVRHN